jgi:hypothetical protein
LRSGDEHVDAPFVHAHIDAADAADGIDDQERGARAHRRADGGEVRDHAGRAFVMNADDRAIIARCEPRGHCGGIGCFAPGNVEPINARAHRFGDIGKAFAELPVR